MNIRTHMIRVLLGSVGLCACTLTGCQGPLAFQDPLAARSTPTWRSQSRFARRPESVPGYAQPEASYQNMAPQSGFQNGTRQPTRAGQAPLLSWDGGVALAETEGRTNTASLVPDHGLEPVVEGRMHILNLYQEVLDERDSLLAEVERLGMALQTSLAEKTMVRAAESEVTTRIAALEEAKRSLLEQNQNLAARLTTAQIRRLESEKLLLQTQIAWHRDRAVQREGDMQEDGVTAMVEK